MRKRLLVILALTSAIIVWSVSGSHAQGPFPSQITAALRTLGWVTSTSTYTQWSKNFLYAASAYWNFGTVSGTSGYGVRDNAGTIQFKNSGGSWVDIPTSAGSGTVTSVSVTTANGVSGTVATATTTPAITLTLGAITPSTVRGLTITTTTGTFTLTNLKTLAVSNTLTFTGTDGSSVNFGTGGTVLYSGGAYVSSIAGTANQVTASAATGAVTLSLPQSIATTSTPQFARLGLGAAADATAALYIKQGTASATGGIQIVGTSTSNINVKAYVGGAGNDDGRLEVLSGGVVKAGLYSDGGSVIVAPNNSLALTLTGGSITSGTAGLFAATVTMNNASAVDGVRRLQVTETSAPAGMLYDAIYGGASGTTLQYSLAKGGALTTLGVIKTTGGSVQANAAGDSLGFGLFTSSNFDFGGLRRESNDVALFTTGTGALQLRNNLSNPIDFLTNNTQRMRLFGSGGLSLGNTTDPGATNLSVTGTIVSPSTVQGASVTATGTLRANTAISANGTNGQTETCGTTFTTPTFTFGILTASTCVAMTWPEYYQQHAPYITQGLVQSGFALYTEQQLTDRIDAAVAAALAARGVR